MSPFLASSRFLLALALLGGLLANPAKASYILDYGDGITVTVRDAPQFAAMGGIRPDGILYVSGIGELEVAGLTPMQLQERIRTILSKQLRNAEVYVAVTAPRPRSVMLLGQIRTQGLMDLSRANQSLLDTITLAGGFTDRAVGTKVLVLRGHGARMRRFEVDVEKMFATGDFSGNMVLEPGDRVQVPEVWYPDLRQIAGGITVVATVVSAVVLVFNLYDRTGLPGSTPK